MSKFPNRLRALALMGAAPINSSVASFDIVGDIDARSLFKLRQALRAAPSATRLRLNINSPGGDVACGFAMMDAIEAHPAKVKIANGTGQVCSAAILPFAACNVRRLADNTSALLHGISLDPDHAPRWTAGAYFSRAEQLARIDHGIVATLAERFGCPEAVLAAEMATEAPLPPGKALSIGLAHFIAGYSRPLQKSWPSLVSASIGRGPMMLGANSYLISPGYLRACALAGI